LNTEDTAPTKERGGRRGKNNARHKKLKEQSYGVGRGAVDRLNQGEFHLHKRGGGGGNGGEGKGIGAHAEPFVAADTRYGLGKTLKALESLSGQNHANYGPGRNLTGTLVQEKS